MAYDPATGSAELADREHVVRMRGPELAWRRWRPGDLFRVELEPVLKAPEEWGRDGK